MRLRASFKVRAVPCKRGKQHNQKHQRRLFEGVIQKGVAEDNSHAQRPSRSYAGPNGPEREQEHGDCGKDATFGRPLRPIVVSFVDQYARVDAAISGIYRPEIAQPPTGYRTGAGHIQSGEQNLMPNLERVLFRKPLFYC